MTERPLARAVVVRQRFARLMQLGDRKDPAGWTPALVLGPTDPEVATSIAPFSSTRNSEGLPASISLHTRENLCLPFDSTDSWVATEGLVLPPSLAESDSGEFSTGDQLLTVSWQSLHHDELLKDPELQPSVICLVDALQLSHSPGSVSYTHLTLPTKA